MVWKTTVRPGSTLQSQPAGDTRVLAYPCPACHVGPDSSGRY